VHLPSPQGQRQGQCAGGAVLEAKVSGDVFSLDHCDVLQNRTSHPFALPVGSAGIAPESWEGRRQGQDGRPLFVIELETILFPLLLVAFLGCGQGAGLVVPFRLQAVSDEAVVGTCI